VSDRVRKKKQSINKQTRRKNSFPTHKDRPRERRKAKRGKEVEAEREFRCSVGGFQEYLLALCACVHDLSSESKKRRWRRREAIDGLHMFFASTEAS
jgi:hypothetical protein